ncbi:aldose epimerase [Nocardioides mangrovicus]|uniref:Aldose epimerase n=1 Tax=Nocardioides mangrovicus TaxID=2478913 RepID=A0A3L8P4U4_9ACTN|nr:aldose 1-epimerase family protein [Nocardioides mangrovicus]RLV50245.1 aldose epimerase [Nocardioides mangrovicus]
MIPPSGEQHVISSDGYEATITSVGATLRSLTHHGRDLVLGFAEDEMCSGGRGQTLLPWPNRLRDGAYTWDGHDQQLPLSEPARHNASHGLVRWCWFRPLAQDETSVELVYRLAAQPGYPWSLDVSVRYAVGADGLAVTVTVLNLAASAAPFAYGAHPYLTLGVPVDELTLALPGASRLTVDERKLPTGVQDVEGTPYDLRAGRELGELLLDDAFRRTGTDGVRLSDASGHGVELWADEAFGWFQAYTGDDQPALARRAVAVEPMTAPPDAFGSGADVIRLEPETSWSASWGLRSI